MTKLDKQIRKLILKVCDNEYEHEYNLIEKENVNKTVSQIKQSILKAIVEKCPERDVDNISSIDPYKRYYGNGFNKCKEEFESVIKELLSEAKK